MGRAALRPALSIADGAGRFLAFGFEALVWIPFALKHYRRQMLESIRSVAWGRGNLIADGGVLSVLAILGAAIGIGAAIEGLAALDVLGLGSLAGVIGGMALVRELGPILAGIGFAAQAGCRMTAEIGAMRLGEEVDACESLSVRPIPFIVSTRVFAGLVCMVPGYLIALVAGMEGTRIIATSVFSIPGGTYQHYFGQFVTVPDLALSTVKAVVFCLVVTLIHCYCGFFATGGPEGVGIATGNAVRASLVAIVSLDFLLTVIMWGAIPQLEFVG